MRLFFYMYETKAEIYIFKHAQTALNTYDGKWGADICGPTFAVSFCDLGRKCQAANDALRGK